jgi:hypothetical protein
VFLGGVWRKSESECFGNERNERCHQHHNMNRQHCWGVFGELWGVLRCLGGVLRVF